MGQAEIFRRAKSEWRFVFPLGPLGPGFAKIRTGAIPPPRLGLPNQRYRARIRDTSSGPTGGLSLQNLEHLRFKICAWLCRTNGTGAFPP